MSNNSASGVRFLVPVQLITLALLLVPAFAQAKSEYRACMETQQRMSAFAGFGGGSFRAFPTTSWSRSGAAYYPSNGYPGYFYGSDFSISLISSSAMREADRVSAIARHCRQFRKTNPPSFRVVTVKSHSLRPAVNDKK
jgi:hypothetical protein